MPAREEVNAGDHAGIQRQPLLAVRQELLAMRASEEFGDDAFHRVEEELDWLEMAAGTGR